MRCPDCMVDHPVMRPARVEISTTLRRRQFVGKLDGYICPQCRGDLYTSGEVDRWERAVATYLLTYGFDSHEEMTYVMMVAALGSGELKIHGIAVESMAAPLAPMKCLVALAALQKLGLPVPPVRRLLNLVDSRHADAEIRLRLPSKRRKRRSTA